MAFLTNYLIRFEPKKPRQTRYNFKARQRSRVIVQEHTNIRDNSYGSFNSLLSTVSNEDYET
jgi:hypothetical protein